MIALPGGVNYVEPFGGARVAVVVLVELNAVFLRFLGPPGRDDIERNPAAADAINICGLLGKESGQMKRGADGDHELERICDSGERGGGGPGNERRCINALDVVEIQLGDEREVEADFFAAASEVRNISPRGLHLLVFHIAQPAAENGEPESVAHQRDSLTR